MSELGDGAPPVCPTCDRADNPVCSDGFHYIGAPPARDERSRTFETCPDCSTPWTAPTYVAETCPGCGTHKPPQPREWVPRSSRDYWKQLAGELEDERDQARTLVKIHREERDIECDGRIKASQALSQARSALGKSSQAIVVALCVMDEDTRMGFYAALASEGAVLSTEEKGDGAA